MNKEIKRLSENGSSDLDSQIKKAAKQHVQDTSEEKVVKTNTKKSSKVSNSRTVQVQVNKHPMTKLPAYRTAGSAGMDVYANITFQKVVKPGETVLIPTGLKTVIPPGYCIEVYPRSGLALNKQITVLNSPGLIDEDYRDEIGVIIINHGTEQFLVNKHDRIAQLRLKKVEKVEWLEITDDDFNDFVDKEETTRRGGFGSTGK